MTTCFTHSLEFSSLTALGRLLIARLQKLFSYSESASEAAFVAYLTVSLAYITLHTSMQPLDIAPAPGG